MRRAVPTWVIPITAVGAAGPPDFVMIGELAVLKWRRPRRARARCRADRDRVKTASELYTLDLRPNGTLHGIVRGLMENGYMSEIDVEITR